MDLTLTPEQELLVRTARDFLAAACPIAHVRAMEQDARGYDPDLVREMGRLGWLGIALPESLGGSGQTFLEAALLLEEMGRVLLPSPYLPSSVVAAPILMTLGADIHRRRWLPRIVTGDAIAALALAEPGWRDEEGVVTVEIRARDDDFVLAGAKAFVPYASHADVLLVLARPTSGSDGPTGRAPAAPTEDRDACARSATSPSPATAPGASSHQVARTHAGDATVRVAGSSFGVVEVGTARPTTTSVATRDTIVLVEKGAPGVTVTRRRTLAGDHLYDVGFDETPVSAGTPLGASGGASSAVAAACARAAIGSLAYMVGAAERALEMTVEYAKTRVQFGRPIGSFQAVAHRCVDMRSDIDALRYLVYQAAWTLAGGDPVGLAVGAAKAYGNEALRRIFMHAHQVFGAIGFSTEHDLHLFTRRAKAVELSWGSASAHRERVAMAMGLGDIKP